MGVVYSGEIEDDKLPLMSGWIAVQFPSQPAVSFLSKSQRKIRSISPSDLGFIRLMQVHVPHNVTYTTKRTFEFHVSSDSQRSSIGRE